MPQITPNLWFDTQALEAAEFYVSVFPNSKITNVAYYGDSAGDRAGTVLVVDFELDGNRFTALNGGPEFTFDEAVSFLISTDGQEETDAYWTQLLADGGKESQCGWLKDRFGLSWQVWPQQAAALVSDPDPKRAERAMTAMLAMVKIAIAAMQAAADVT